MSCIQDNLNLAKSLNKLEGPAGSIGDILNWLKMRNQAICVDVKLIDFSDMQNWKFNKNGDLEHSSGRFFAIRGVEISIEGLQTLKSFWSQPIIDQPEVGFLGIITKEIDGILCFLLQAKIEPGNINHVQLSPTLQATRSNYMQVHKGKSPQYLNYFLDTTNHKIWVDQLQSEQGGRFLRKRNRNIIIEVTEDIAPHDDFIWVTLGQLKSLMQYDNVVNMDTRTVISCLGWGGNEIMPLFKYVETSRTKNMLLSLVDYDRNKLIKETLFWLSELKSKYSMQARIIPLNSVDEWQIKDNEIVREDKKYFRVIGSQVTIENREVATWSQPLVQPLELGLCGLIMKTINGITKFLIQAKVECGNFDVVELAPTVQCLTGGYDNGKPQYLNYILNASSEQIIYDNYQSEEGGRFYQEQNRNILVEVQDDFPDFDIPENFRWMTLGELQEFLKFNNYLNIQLRSLIAAINIFSL